LKGKKVLVTGGAGFIGSHLTRHLLNEGAKVLVVDNLFVGKEEFIPDGVLFAEIDIRSKKMESIVEKFKPDVIIHLAAIHYIPYCNANPEETFDVNVMGTRKLLEVSRKIDFLFASSAAVYPPVEGPLTEDICGPIDIYGKTKIIGEDLVRLNCEQAIITRFFNVYGQNDMNSHLIPEIIKQVNEGKREIELGNLTPKRDYIYVDDLCRAIIKLLKLNRKGTYNLGTGIEYSVKEVVEIVSQILGEEIKILQNRKRKRKAEREHLLADITKIQSDTAWKPRIKLKEGLRKLLDKEEI
jgi:UDP-glucose 4-epimerase